MMYNVTTTNSAVTVDLAKQIGGRLHGGEFIELVSDVGGGKTTFVKGLLAGLGYYGQVPSPTFTISRVYDVRDGMKFYHYDFYRLHEPDMATAELDEVEKDAASVVAVEWGEQVPDVLPNERIVIRIEQGSKEDERHISITAPETLNYVIQGLTA